MKPCLLAELIKLRRTRTFAFVGLAIGTSLLIAGLVVALTEPSAAAVLNDVCASDTSSFFILILAILAVVGITGEWRHHTITSALLAAPDRIRFLGAKTIAFAVAGTALSLFIAVTVAAIEPILVGLVPEVGRWAHFGILAVAAAGLQDSRFGGDDLRGVAAATLGLVAWIVVLFGAAALLLRGRDLE